MLKKVGDHAGKDTIVGSVVGLGVGGASFFAAMKAAQNISALQSRWWATPAALAVVGHIAKRWSNPTGQAVVGAAGALLAYSYYVQSQTPATTATTTPAAGFDNAGRFIDAGAMQRQLPRSRAGMPGGSRMPGYRSQAGSLQGA